VKIVIIGAGAMGCLLGTRVFSQAEVTLFDIDEQTVEQISTHGVLVTELGGAVKSYPVPIIAAAGEYEGRADVVILFTKSYGTTAAARSAQALLKEDGFVLTLQNGVGNVEQINQVFDRPCAVAGITAQAANVVRPGHSVHAGEGVTRISSLDGYEDQVSELVEIFLQAGLETEVSRDAESLIWGKLLINVGINAFCALLRVHNGVVAEVPPGRELMTAAVHEAAMVAQALGIALPYDDPMAAVVKVCHDTAANRASMLQDVQRQARTEIDAINGAIVQKGLEVGVATPVNACITQLIKALEATYDKRIHD